MFNSIYFTSSGSIYCDASYFNVKYTESTSNVYRPSPKFIPVMQPRKTPTNVSGQIWNYPFSAVCAGQTINRWCVTGPFNSFRKLEFHFVQHLWGTQRNAINGVQKAYVQLRNICCFQKIWSLGEAFFLIQINMDNIMFVRLKTM